MAVFSREVGLRLDSLLQLAGLSLFLATIEMVIPKPMPFLKLGIANLPVLLFVRQLRFRELLLLVFLKVFCQNLLSGSLLSYIAIFSACSSLASGMGMWLLARLPRKYFSLLGISILGAASSNGMQLLLALHYFFPGTGSLLIPWSLSFGLGSGVFLGLFALQFARGSLWYQRVLDRLNNPEKVSVAERCPQNQRFEETEHFALLRFVFGLLSLALMFAIEKYEPVYLVLELWLFLWLNSQLGYRPWWNSMLTLLAVLLFFHLLLPSGRLLWQIDLPPFHFRLTQGALERGFGRAFFLLNLIQISRFAVSLGLRLPGRTGRIIQLVFCYYEGFLNSPTKFRSRRPFCSLDAILCLASPAAAKLPERKLPAREPQLNYGLLGLLLLVQTGFLLLGKFFPLYRLLGAVR